MLVSSRAGSSRRINEYLLKYNMLGGKLHINRALPPNFFLGTWSILTHLVRQNEPTRLHQG